MRWDEICDLPCSVARTLSVVGDRWTLLVLRDCFLGARRFEAFERSLGISPHLLSTRLTKLVEESILERRLYSERPRRHEYRLTEKGVDLYPVVVSLTRWGDRWMAHDDGPPIAIEHRTCGHETTPVLTCSECHEPLDPREMRPLWNGPRDAAPPGVPPNPRTRTRTRRTGKEAR